MAVVVCHETAHQADHTHTPPPPPRAIYSSSVTHLKRDTTVKKYETRDEGDRRDERTRSKRDRRKNRNKRGTRQTMKMGEMRYSS